MSRRIDMVIMFGYLCILLFGVLVKEIPTQFGTKTDTASKGRSSNNHKSDT
ncbi:hypothetical protein J45TS6_40910 [Paenibacillus sp. J45TS6]|uniref:hypothetical protein n=1 Tax=Paenibacillus sp. J45TS6 TaxID=2807196 RepID=UPI001B24CA67|nr:hypothetical protein [Paenibacillus sp. J45TS6]GIP45632.1 hypothetical protein J45TS6_40910 [Paenibacillus sp. J45TS6]